MKARRLDLAQAFVGRDVPRYEAAAAAAGGEPRGVAGSVDHCLVVSACLNHELAQEDVFGRYLGMDVAQVG